MIYLAGMTTIGLYFVQLFKSQRESIQNQMKAIILAGGLGTRISEETGCKT